MNDIYNQHDKAFAQVSAYVVMHGAEKVATIAFKFPRDGVGRLNAYVHWIGLEMVRGCASGYGYDKRSAACANATRALPLDNDTPDVVRAMANGYAAFRDALERDGGQTWDGALRDAGFVVWQAV